MYSQIKESINAINKKKYDKIIVCEDTADYFQHLFYHFIEVDKDLFDVYLKTFIVNNDDCYIGNGISPIYKFSDIPDFYTLAISGTIYITDKHKHFFASVSVIPNDGEHKENCVIQDNGPFKNTIVHFEIFDLNSIHDKSYLLSIPLKQKRENDELYKIIKNDDVDKLIQMMVSNDGKLVLKKLILESYNTMICNVDTIYAFALMYGSIKCFKWLYLNGYKVEDIEEYLIFGNNLEIFHILEQDEVDYLNIFIYAIVFHKNELFEYVYSKIDEPETYFDSFIEHSLICSNYTALEFILNHTPANKRQYLITDDGVYMTKAYVRHFEAIKEMITKYDYIPLKYFNNVLLYAIEHDYSEEIINFVINNNLPISKDFKAADILKAATAHGKDNELVNKLITLLFDDFEAFKLS